MIVETGHYALVLALALAIVQFAIPLAGALLFGTDRERKAKRRRERDSD